MLVERARRHYEERGFTVSAPDPQAGAPRADLLVEKQGKRRAVRIDDDPLGSYQIGALAAEAKRARIQATVICPGTPDVIAACEQFGVEHISPEGLGEETPVIAVGRRPEVVPFPMRPAEPVPAPQPTIVASVAEPAVPAWRWGVVAVIWLLAVVAWTYLLLRIF